MSRNSAESVGKALEMVHARTKADVRLTSTDCGWDAIAISRFSLGRIDVTLPALGVVALAINYGDAFRLERTLRGRSTGGCATPGQLAIFPPDAPTHWAFDRKGDSVFIHLSRTVLDMAIEEGIGRDRRSAEIIPRLLIRDLALERIADLLLREICDPGPDSGLLADTMAHELAGRLVAAHSNLIPATQCRPIALARLKRAQEFMRENLQRPMSLQEISDAAGVSAFHFARGFKEAVGQPPHHYLTELRLAQARALLHDPNLRVGDVARAVGFTHSHFTAAYTRRMGITPTKLREVLWS